MIARLDIARNDDGSTAVEFALIALLLLMTILFILSVGTMLYLGQALDVATTKAARQIMLGTVQNAGTSKDDFRTNYVCASLPALFDCSKIVVNVQTVTEAAQPGGYYGLVNSTQTALIVPTSSTAQYAPGVQQSYEYVQVVYPITLLPTPIAAILGGGATYNGSKAVMLVSTAAFRNEQY